MDYGKIDDLNYLAGLVDADGHIGLHKVGEGRYCPSLSFVNTNYDLILLFQKHLKGNIYTKKKKSVSHATVYEIVVRNNLDFLEASNTILPFLRIKKKKLLIAKKYAESIKKLAGCKLTLELRKEREQLRKEWENTKIEM